MAKLTAPASESFDLGPLSPAGTFIATCLGIADQFGVERPTFNDPTKTEVQDVTRFLFAFRAEDGRPYKVQTYEFRISGSPKSNLVKFLTAWLGRAPTMGWDYCELVGAGAMITVAHKPSRDGSKTYANLVGIAPVIAQLKSQVLPLAAFGAAVPATAPSTPAPAPAAPAQPAPSSATPSSGARADRLSTLNPQLSTPPATAPALPAWNPSIDPESECPF